MLGTRSRARGAYNTPLEDEDAGEREDQNQHLEVFLEEEVQSPQLNYRYSQVRVGTYGNLK